LLLLNQLTPVIEQRDVLFWGVVPDLTFPLFFLLLVLVACLGFAFPKRARFADVLYARHQVINLVNASDLRQTA
jgi:hypothetical protein